MLTISKASKANKGRELENLLKDLHIPGGIDQVAGYLKFINNGTGVWREVSTF